MSRDVQKIAALAIEDTEKKLIQSTLGLAACRGLHYRLLESGENIREAAAVVVNGRVPMAVRLWARLDSMALASPLSSIVIDPPASGLPVTPTCTLRRPLRAQRFMDALAEMSVRNDTAPSAGPRAPRLASTLESGMAPIANSRNRVAGVGLMQLNGKILLVDDSAVVRRHMTFALSRFGLEVDTSDNGAKALNMIRDNHYDLVFLDVVMPEHDGFEICKAIKRGARRKLPVVMLTSKSSPFDRVRGMLAGCDTYLTKPVELARLELTLSEFLGASLSPATAKSGSASGGKN